MKQHNPIVLVFDCGATNVRVIAINSKGTIVAAHSAPNETDPDPYYSKGRIWDFTKLWEKLCNASHKVLEQIDRSSIIGVTFTTFGVDGTLVNKEGEMLYPIISWQCQRTDRIMENIDQYIPLQKLYEISGVYPYNFNTINKIIWLKEEHPGLFNKAYRFLFLPSLFIHRVTGNIQNDATMLGTSMMSDLETRNCSKEICESLGINTQLFGEIGEPGTCAGHIHEQGEKETGIPKNIPVFFSGHDTQFALYGSGAKQNEPILSSGTWEILMARTQSCNASTDELNKKLTTELDAQKGLYCIGQNWLGSGVLEWFYRLFYPNLQGTDLYETAIKEAETIEDFTENLLLDPTFYNDSTTGLGGKIIGLTINTRRQDLYKALLESLAFRLRESLEALEEAGAFKTQKITCVGGGSKNRLWNELRATICQVPIQLIEQKETTVLGAALFAFSGAGIYNSVDEARKNIDFHPTLIMPSEEKKSYYEEKYQEYLQLRRI